MKYLLQEICWTLEIKVPGLYFLSKEEMIEIVGEKIEALFSPKINGIYMVKKDNYGSMDLFNLMHEARHCWQFAQDGEDFLFKSYDSEDEHAYLTHPCEIDANAFATMVMQALIEKFPLKEYEYEDAQDMYEKKYKELCETYGFKGKK